MLTKITDTIKYSSKDPKIIAALALGIVAPTILKFAYAKLSKMIKAKKQHSHLYVGIELGGTNYNIAFGKPESDKNGNLIEFKLVKQTSGRVSDQPENTLREIAHAINDTLSDK